MQVGHWPEYAKAFECNTPVRTAHTPGAQHDGGPVDLLIYLGGGSAALLAIGALARGVWRINRRIVVIVNAVRELAPNGGRSIKDTVTRTETKVDDTARELCELKRQFDEHLSSGA